MPWQERSPLMEKMGFVRDLRTGLYRLSDLADQYGISRKTAYKWWHRFQAEGEGGLAEHPHKAHEVANRTPRDVEQLIVELRRQHRTWGAKKLLVVLAKRIGADRLPSRSTVAEILKRHGLVNSKVRRRREGHPGRPMTEPTTPNEIWGADFKGHFRTGDGQYCYPFTVSDLHSRYLICCDGYLTTRAEGVKESLERAFREYGLPQAIRTDNGTPFASTGIGRLTTLGVWLLKLGIRRELIQPGCPAQNGRHERVHRTLKFEATQPAAANLKRQQARFDAFRTEFNESRPHEALAMQTPATLYTPSPRPFTRRLLEPEYPGNFEVRRVSRNGGVRWKGEWLPVGHALIEEHIGFEQIADGLWDVHYAGLRIGRFDERDLRLVGTLGSHYRNGRKGDHA
jgi:putative transposase